MHQEMWDTFQRFDLFFDPDIEEVLSRNVPESINFYDVYGLRFNPQGGIVLRAGLAAGMHVPLEDLRGARPVEETPPYGHGPAIQPDTNRDTVWVYTASRQQVAIECKAPARFVVPGGEHRVRRIIVNLENPRGFVDAVLDRIRPQD